MLPKLNRLPKSAFDVVKEKGVVINGRLLGVSFLRRDIRDDDNLLRVGIVVSKRISNKAVNRNELKRILRQVVKRMLNELKSGYDIVLLSKKGLLGSNRQEIENELRMLFKKEGLI